MQEYCTVMKPLTVALDILQGDECAYGTLLPTLTSLMSKTLALKDDLSKMTASLPDAIVKVRLLFGFVKFIIPFMVGRCYTLFVLSSEYYY